MADWAAYVRRRLHVPALQDARQADIVEDLARQLDDAYREALASGATDEEAIARAEQHVADWDGLARQLSRASRARKPRIDRWGDRLDDRGAERPGGFTRLDRLRQDVVYGWRVLRRRPAVTALVVVSLALGIGANTAIFSVTHALLFRPLPVPDPGSLVVLTNPDASGLMTGVEDGERSLLSYHEFEGLAAGNQVLSGLFALSSEVSGAPVMLPGGEEAPASIRLVSGGYFPTVGVAPQVGRAFGPEVDAARMAHPVALVSDRFWKRRLQGAPDIIGRTIQIRRTAFEIVGVMPAEFTGVVVGEAPDVWVPLTMQQAIEPAGDWLTQPPGTVRRTMFLQVMGRLKPGVSLEQAGAALNGVFLQGLRADAESIADEVRRSYLLDAHLVLREARFGLSAVRADYREPLVVLMTLVGLLLLLTCANVANLLLARATGRERELAARAALGAGRGRLVRQLLTESLLLAVFGAIAGWLVATWGVHALLAAVARGGQPIVLHAPLDGTVLAFTLAVAIVTGLLFGVAPALRATRLDLNLVLRGSSREIAGTRSGARRWPVGKLLAGAQMAISLLLLVIAGLFVQSLWHLGAVPLGYESDHLVTFELGPATDGYPRAAVEPLLDNLLTRAAAVPGVQAASLSFDGLFSGSDLESDVSIVGFAPPAGMEMSTAFDLVGPGYFGAVGVPVLRGRDVERRDSAGVQGCWLNASAARHFFPDQNPLGRHVVAHFSFGDSEYEVRGVVADSRAHSLRSEIARRVYLPYFASVIHPGFAVFEVRTAGDPALVAPALRRVVREQDARLTTPEVRTVAGLLGAGLSRDRLTAQLAALFGVLALVLASVGLYGVLSYAVSRRISEIGVRLALGARRGRIITLVVGDALNVTAIGAVLGIGGALAVTRLLGHLLFGLTAHDPPTFAVAAVLLLVVAALAAAVPAWRASRTDPLTALRHE